jgi:hypothetical protein
MTGSGWAAGVLSPGLRGGHASPTYCPVISSFAGRSSAPPTALGNPGTRSPLCGFLLVATWPRGVGLEHPRCWSPNSANPRGLAKTTTSCLHGQLQPTHPDQGPKPPDVPLAAPYVRVDRFTTGNQWSAEAGGTGVSGGEVQWRGLPGAPAASKCSVAHYSVCRQGHF